MFSSQTIGGHVHSSEYEGNFTNTFGQPMQPDLLTESYGTLLQVASSYNLEALTPSQVTAVEEGARGQAKSKLWYQM